MRVCAVLSECARVKSGLEVEVEIEGAITSKHEMTALANPFGYYSPGQYCTYRPYLAA